jgi:cytochrome d ubiquinol oxidase subunit II
MITLHGATYLAHRTVGAIQARAIRAAVWAAVLMVLAFVAAGLWLRWGGIEGYLITAGAEPGAMADPLAKTVVRSADAWWLNYRRMPALWALPLLGVAGAMLAAALALWQRTLAAFVASALAMAGVIGTAGATMFPFVMPSSTQLAASLTVWDSVSSPLTLALMFWATVIFMPLIVLYTGWAYSVMRGKVTVEHIRANEHTAY